MDAREVIARALYDGRGRAFSLEGFYTDADTILSALEAAGGAIVPVERLNGIAIRKGQQVVVTFKDGKDAFALFDALHKRTMIAAAKDQTDGR